MSDEESLEFELSKEELAYRTRPIETYLFSQLVDSNDVRLYLTIKSDYLNSLLLGKKTDLTVEQQRHLGTDCLLVHSFQLDIFQGDGSQRVPTPIKGNVQILHDCSPNIALVLHLHPWSEENSLYVRIIYDQANEWHSNSYSLKKWDDSFRAEIPHTKLAGETLALQIVLQKEFTRHSVHAGIQNEGNTCYMNCILQILFFLRPFRKVIVESTSSNSTVKALREVFIDLMHCSRKGVSVDAEGLIKAFGRFAAYPRRQQDIHEFLIAFLEELEGEHPVLKQLWQGFGSYITQSKEEGKSYCSVQKDQFCQLDLHMQDVKGNPLKNLQKSIETLLEEDIINEAIDTDEHGKIRVGKHRKFDSLPQLLFFNVKRYAYSAKKNHLKKILEVLEYPQRINLGFLLKTPGSIDSEFVLYGIAVHKGSSPFSGHYYSVINTATSCERPEWCQFNDSSVRLSSLEEALSYSGRKKKCIRFDRKYRRFGQEEVDSEETSYLLCYMRASSFDRFQSTECEVPSDWIARRRLHVREDTAQVEVYVLNTEDPVNLFEDVETMSFPLLDSEDIETQLQKIEQTYLGCKVGSVWKVSKAAKRITHLRKTQQHGVTVSRVFGYKRGHAIPNYLLVVPKSVETYEISSRETRTKLGLIRLEMEGQLVSFRVINKDYTRKFIQQRDSALGRNGSFQQLQEFICGFNDFGVLKYTE